MDEELFCAISSAGRRAFPLPAAPENLARDRTFDLLHIKLDLLINPERSHFTGKATLSLAAINDGLTSVELDAIDLEIRRAEADGLGTLDFETQAKKVVVRLPRPLKSGETLALSFEYEATPRRGLWFVKPDDAYPKRPFQVWSQGEDEDNRYWFPCYDYPNDRATSELLVTVPAKFTAISNGRLVTVEEEKGEKRFHWIQEIPHSSYLISLVIGELTEVKEQFDGIPVQYYVSKGREAEAKRSFGNTVDMLRFFSDKIGIKYPYPKYAQVCVANFIFGGMENTSATTITETTLHDERAHLDFTSDGLVAHELAHQWWGDLLTCRDWSHAWLNEGFATYFEALYREYHEGEDEFRQNMAQKAEEYFKEDKERYRRPIVCRTYFHPAEVFDRHLYQKASWVLHGLRFLLGDDLFWKSLRHYAKKHYAGIVETDDLRKAIEEATGRNLEWFFEQWLYKAGHPEFRMKYSYNDDTQTVSLTVAQVQDPSIETPIFRTPVEVSFLTSRGEQTFKVQVSEKEQSFSFALGERPRGVMFDPKNWILKSVEFDKPQELWMNELREAKHSQSRTAAAKALAKVGSRAAIKALQDAMLNDKFWAVRGEAAKALGTIGTSEALDALMKGLELSHPKARRMVVQAFGEFKDERAAEALIRILDKGDASYFVEAEAAKSLGKTRSTKAFEKLQEVLRTKESYNEVIRTQVFEGLSELKNKGAVPIAMEWSKYGKPTQVREVAVSTLGKLGEGNSEVLDYLTSLLKDAWFRVRTTAAEALGNLKDDRAVPALQKLIDSELDGRVKRYAREAILRIQESRERSREWQQMREDFDKLREENRALKERLMIVEKQLTEKP